MAGAKGLRDVKEWVVSLPERPMMLAFILFIVFGIIVMDLSWPYYQNDSENFRESVMVELHGMLFDILVFGIILFWLNRNADKRKNIRHYLEEIDDFRNWKSDEATHRTVGNIKRLNNYKVHKMNLSHCFLEYSNLNFVNLSESNLNGINLKGSNLLEANLSGSRMNQADLTDAKLNQINMEFTLLNGARLEDANLIKARMKGAQLIAANMKNAYLFEADMEGVDLHGAILDNAYLYKAKLRGAQGLTADQLLKTRSYYLAELDPELEAEMRALTQQLSEQNATE